MKKQLLLCSAFIVALALNAQVNLVKDINQGTGDSNPNEAFVYNGKIYFAADSGAGETTGNTDVGNELWVSDGTPGGTMLFKDIYTDSSSSSPEGFFEYNGSLYFSASAGSGSQLFKLNASEDDVEAITGVPGFNNSCELNGLIYFIYVPGPGLDNLLYVFDGTSASHVTNNSVGTLGTEHLLNNTANISSTYITVFNNKIFFYGTMSLEKDTVGYELYSYDPSTGEFARIKDIAPGLNPTMTAPDNSSINNFNVVNGKLYFKAETSGYLYESDGTEAGTKRVVVAENAGITGALSFYVWNDKIYFEGDNGSSDGNSYDQLWVYDPVADTVTELSNELRDHDPRYYAGVGNDLFYGGRNDSDTDWHVYRLKNGTDLQLISATNALDCEWLFEFGDKLYFEGDDDGAGINFLYGTELYVIDPATLSVANKQLTGINSIYPNPATDYITVDKKLVNATYGIYDITGKVVKQGVLETQKLDLRLNTGLYIFKAQTDLGFYAQKIVIR